MITKNRPNLVTEKFYFVNKSSIHVYEGKEYDIKISYLKLKIN